MEKIFLLISLIVFSLEALKAVENIDYLELEQDSEEEEPIIILDQSDNSKNFSSIYYKGDRNYLYVIYDGILDGSYDNSPSVYCSLLVEMKEEIQEKEIIFDEVYQEDWDFREDFTYDEITNMTLEYEKEKKAYQVAYELEKKSKKNKNIYTINFNCKIKYSYIMRISINAINGNYYRVEKNGTFNRMGIYIATYITILVLIFIICCLVCFCICRLLYKIYKKRQTQNWPNEQLVA